MKSVVQLLIAFGFIAIIGVVVVHVIDRQYRTAPGPGTAVAASNPPIAPAPASPAPVRTLSLTERMHAAAARITTDYPLVKNWSESIQMRRRKEYLDALSRGAPACCADEPLRKITTDFAAALDDESLDQWLKMSLRWDATRGTFPINGWTNEMMNAVECGGDEEGTCEAIFNVARNPMTKIRAMAIWNRLASYDYDKEMEDYRKQQTYENAFEAKGPPRLRSMPVWDANDGMPP